MTDKTEAQPEALRLEVHQECADFATSLRSAANVVQLQGRKAPPSFLKAADLFEQAAAEIQQLKAQLSARQAAPDGWRIALERIADPRNKHFAGDAQIVARDALSAAPPPSEREQQKHEENRELAETAMRFVDRAGDVHPGIDDADRICAEFHAAMMEVIEKWHPMPMPARIGATNDNP